MQKLHVKIKLQVWSVKHNHAHLVHYFFNIWCAKTFTTITIINAVLQKFNIWFWFTHSTSLNTDNIKNNYTIETFTTVDYMYRGRLSCSTWLGHLDNHCFRDGQLEQNSWEDIIQTSLAIRHFTTTLGINIFFSHSDAWRKVWKILYHHKTLCMWTIKQLCRKL